MLMHESMCACVNVRAHTRTQVTLKILFHHVHRSLTVCIC